MTQTTPIQAFHDWVKSDEVRALIADHLLKTLTSHSSENPEFRDKVIDREWQIYLAGWQASRQALEIVLPESFPLGDGYGHGLDPEDTRGAIEAAGVRVKT